MINTDNSSSTMQLLRVRDPESAFPTPPRRLGRPNIPPNMNTADSPIVNTKLLSYKCASPPTPDITNGKSSQDGSSKSQGLSNVKDLENKWDRLNISKKKSQYFEKEFASREPSNTAKERVVKDSVITVEMKLNCCLDGGEQQFHVDFSFVLSEIYQRPASCIMIMVSTEYSILLNGTSDPAYCLTVTALSSEIAATMNKRSAHLIQKFMSDNLDIPTNRGVVKFEAIPEGNLATNGLTALQQIQELEVDYVDSSLLRTMSRQLNRQSKTSCGTTRNDRERTTAPVPRSFTPFMLQSDSDANVIKAADRDMSAHKTIKKRKSLMSFFGI